MLAQGINCPTGLILRGIDRGPRRLDKVDETSLKLLRSLVVAPACGCLFKFDAPGTDKFEEGVVTHQKIRPVPQRAGLRAEAAQSSSSMHRQAALQAAATRPATSRRSYCVRPHQYRPASAADQAHD